MTSTYPRPFFPFFTVPPFRAPGAPKRSSIELALPVAVPGRDGGADEGAASPGVAGADVAVPAPLAAAAMPAMPAAAVSGGDSEFTSVDFCSGLAADTTPGAAAAAAATAVEGTAVAAGDPTRRGEDAPGSPALRYGAVGMRGSGGVADGTGGAGPIGILPPGRGAALTLRDSGPRGGGAVGFAALAASAPAFLFTHFLRSGS